MILSSLAYLLSGFVLRVCSSNGMAPRGIPPAKAQLYSPLNNFTCFDGSLTIPYNQVNDDYCDCEDGTDEPGTSACPNAVFYCPNEGYYPVTIPSSRVNDGICDCCDGSDEYLKKNCEDVCDILGAEALAEAERQAALINQGNSLRREMSVHGKQLRQQKNSRLKELERDKSEAERLRGEAEEIKRAAEGRESEALEVYRQIEEEQRQAQIEREKEDAIQEAHNAFKILDTNEDSKLQQIELLDKMKSSPTYANRDESSLLEELKFLMESREEIPWEEFQECCWSRLKPMFIQVEPIITSDEEQAKGEVLPVEYPGQVEDEEEEKTDDDDEDIEKDDEEGDSSPPPTQEDEDTDSKYDEETRRLMDEASKSRQHYDEADKAVRDIEREMSLVNEFLAKDFGPEDEFSPLCGECFSYTDREYTYKLCPFDCVIQSSKHGGSETSLGTWNGWASEDYSAMSYTRGQSCWNGPQRSTKVHVTCGLQNEVYGAAEPNKCEYVLDFRTPAACKTHASTGRSSNDDLHDEL